MKQEGCDHYEENESYSGNNKAASGTSDKKRDRRGCDRGPRLYKVGPPNQTNTIESPCITHRCRRPLECTLCQLPSTIWGGPGSSGLLGHQPGEFPKFSPSKPDPTDRPPHSVQFLHCGSLSCGLSQLQPYKDNA